MFYHSQYLNIFLHSLTLVIQSACLLIIISAMTLIACQPLIHLLVLILIFLYNEICFN